MTKSLALLGLAATLFACNSGGTSKQARGYLSSDPCSQHADQASCDVKQGSCRWVSTVDPEIAIATDCPTVAGSPNTTCGGPAPVKNVGVCITNSPCFALDKTSCDTNGACSWAAITSLCPMGATCSSTGFCHPKDDSGTDCACVSPALCPADGDCKPVECDCSGGGQGGSGGACSCVCASCAPGEECKPCACSCDDGGPNCVGTTVKGGTSSTGNTSSPDSSPPSTGSGGSSGACECYCAPCTGDAICPPCACTCPTQPSDPTVGTGNGCVAPTPPMLPVPQDPNTPVACPEIACATLCASGYVRDPKTGCNTCECSPK